MTFTAGKDTKIYAGGADLSAYLHTVEVDPGVTLADATTFGAQFRDRLPTLGDASLSAEGYSDNSTAASVTRVLNAALGQADRVWCVLPGGDAVGAWGWGMLAGQSDVRQTSPIDGLAAVAVTAEATGAGAEYMMSLHALAAETAAGNGTIYDRGASTAAGGAAYLQCTAFSGTSITVSIHHSSDNFAADDTVLATFTAVSAGQVAERVAISGTVKRYVRAVWSGTFSSATFFVGLSAL